jgi:anti-anti-sigma factor
VSSPTTPGLPKVERSGDVTVITFTRDPVRDVESVLARELLGLAGEGGCHLLLDFTNVDRLNSTELGTLITLHKQIRDVGGRLTMFNLSERVFEVFAITRLDTLLGICRESAAPGPEALAATRPRDRTPA